MAKYNLEFKIGENKIGQHQPTYFIADIAANHDGDLHRAKDLIWKAKEAGADCAKFQHFQASQIVSDYGFSQMSSQLSHQAKWKKSVHEVYDHYHTRRDWTEELVKTAEEAKIEFMTTPYDVDTIREFANIVSAFKIGSGDITFHSAIEVAASYGKPILLATGASDIDEVDAAVNVVTCNNPNICLMQCNTNYTGSMENFKYVNLNVLKSFELKWPGMPFGFSDHTPGHSAVLGAIALGARVVEKHFTDDNSREGPDHQFALNPHTWRHMIEASRELEFCFGDGVKRVEENEKETVIIQRRALRLKKSLKKGDRIKEENLIALRPCKPGECAPCDIDQVIGRPVLIDIEEGDAIKWENIG